MYFPYDTQENLIFFKKSSQLSLKSFKITEEINWIHISQLRTFFLLLQTCIKICSATFVLKYLHQSSRNWFSYPFLNPFLNNRFRSLLGRLHYFNRNGARKWGNVASTIHAKMDSNTHRSVLETKALIPVPPGHLFCDTEPYNFCCTE